MWGVDEIGKAASDVYGKAKNVISPPRPPDVTKSPAYGAENTFASGLGGERSAFGNGPAAPTIAEGAPPPPPTGAAAGTGNGHGQIVPPASSTSYVDPTARDAQLKGLQLDQAAAEGNAPSAAEDLFRKSTDEGMQSQLGLAATLQGSNPGMALRSGEAGAANVAAQSSSQAAALRAQEMATARGQYDSASSTARGENTDIAKANQTAQIQQQLANNQFYLGLTDEQQKALVAMLSGAQTNAKAQQDYNSGQQVFWGGLAAGGAKAAAAAA